VWACNNGIYIFRRKKPKGDYNGGGGCKIPASKDKEKLAGAGIEKYFTSLPWTTYNRTVRESNHKLQMKKATFKIAYSLLCPGLDSNQHTLSGTTTSKWLVYQFQHLGSRPVLFGAANITDKLKSW